MVLGMGGGFERLHYLLESAFDCDGELSISFLRVRILLIAPVVRHGW